MRSLPRPVLALLLTAAVLAPSGCTKPKGGAITVTVIGDSPRLIDPAVGPLPPPDAALLGSVAQGLVQFDARGQIDAGLAERWTVTDDGLSYIFRLRSGTWPSGRKIDAREVARILNRERRSASRNAIKDSIGAISEIVAMTDRVLEIRLVAPRPNLLQLLAQPEFAILRIEQDSTGEGSGPFILTPGKPEEGLRLHRILPGADGDQDVREEVVLTGLPAPSAIARFRAGQAQMVLGGSFSDLPVVRAGGVARGTLRFDPVVGLFALVPARQGGPLADKALRSLISRAIDRDALVAAFDIDGLTARATLLQPGLDGIGNPLAPGWLAQPLAQRRAALITEASRLIGNRPKIVLTVSFPAGPGSTLLFNRLAADLAPLGIGLEAAARGMPVDLTLIDEVAPSTSPAWFVRRLHCGVVALCDAEVDTIADAARETQSPQQRAQFLSLAAQLIDRDVLIIPLTAPIRWSLVSPDLPGFAENRFARHTLSDLAIKPAREGN